MNEIINAVTQRTGLPPDKAQAAVAAVLDHLRAKLPPALAAHLDGLVGGSASAGAAGGTGSSDMLGGLASEIGGMFGNQK